MTDAGLNPDLAEKPARAQARVAWAFPGQGSQRPWMEAGLASFHDLAQRARSAIGLDVAARCAVASGTRSWPAEELQQAIFVVSCAAIDAARGVIACPGAMVGHSLGEYAALVAAAVLDFESALAVFDVRGRAMAQASTAQPGTMAAVIGLDAQAVCDVCEQTPDVWPANVNAPAQTVVSGTLDGVASVSKRLTDLGARVVALPIPIACHTPLMAAAAEQVRDSLASMRLQPPKATFYSAVDSRPKLDGAAITDALVEGMTRPVRFLATVKAMHDDAIDSFIEIGPGGVLGGLLRRCVPEANVAVISNDADAHRIRETMRFV